MKSTAPTLVFAATAVAIATAGAARADDSGMSRADAVERAMESNPRVASARARTEQARALARQADAARWPILTLRVVAGPSVEAELVPGTAVQSVNGKSDIGLSDLTAMVGGRASALQPLYTFGKIGLRREAAGHGVNAREAQTDVTRADVAFEVARLYESYLLAHDALLFFEEVAATLQDSIESTREKVEADPPKAPEQDLLRLQVALETANLGLHRARAGLAQSKAGLEAYLGLDDFAPSDDALAPLESSDLALAELQDRALERRPELRALAAGIEANRALAKAEERGYYPDFFVAAWARAAYTPNRDFIQSRYVVNPLYNFVPGLVVGAQWTLQGPMASARRDAQSAKALRLEKLRQWARDGVPAEVTRHYEALARARADITSAGRGVDKAKQWVVRANADYGMGLGGADNLADALEQYARMRVAELDATYRHNLALAELARAVGVLGEELYP